jgi:transcriptional antiterminator NusG
VLILAKEESKEGTEKQEEEKEEPINPFEKRQKIFAVKTQTGKEQIAANLICDKAKKSNEEILSVLVPQELHGYIFVEAYEEEVVEKLIKLISYARSVVPGDIAFKEVEHFLTPVSPISKMSEGDLVEIIKGPFKGEKGKVTRIEEAKDEITLQLTGAVVPIPIVVQGEYVKVLKKGEK